MSAELRLGTTQIRDYAEGGAYLEKAGELFFLFQTLLREMKSCRVMIERNL
jgi:hypothetical protein